MQHLRMLNLLVRVFIWPQYCLFKSRKALLYFKTEKHFFSKLTDSNKYFNAKIKTLSTKKIADPC